MVEPSARIARLAPKVRSVTVLLRMLDTGPLSGLPRFGLCLSGGGHERNQRVPHGLLHGVLGRAIEDEAVDSRGGEHLTLFTALIDNNRFCAFSGAKLAHGGQCRRGGPVTGTAACCARATTGHASAFAVLRLMTSSIFVSCCTGRSAGFSPFRMRPV
jgi:hypothetical protein